MARRAASIWRAVKRPRAIASVSGLRFGCAVVDIGAQSMQWHATFAIPLSASDLYAVQTTRAHNLDALRAEAHRVLHRALHRATEHDALFQLRGNALGDQLRIDFRLAHFFDRNIDRLKAHTLAQFGAQRFDVFALLADHHARTRGVNSHLGVLGRTLDDHL